MTADKGIVARLKGHYVHPADAEAVAKTVFDAILEQLQAGKRVSIPGVGTLTTALKRRLIVAPGPDRGKAIEERVAKLKFPAVISAGEPYEVE